MGWTGLYVAHNTGIEYTTRGTVDRKATLDKRFTCASSDGLRTWEVVKSTLRGSTYYAAVRTVDAGAGTVTTWALVCLTSVTGKGWNQYFNYKDMSEDMGPYSYDCPVSILDMLSDTDSKCAQEWRAACREKAAKKKAENKNPDSLKNLPVGSVITFICQWDMTGGTKRGDTITLQKVQKWDGKTCWTDGYYRWKNSLIPEEYTVTTRGSAA